MLGVELYVGHSEKDKMKVISDHDKNRFSAMVKTGGGLDAGVTMKERRREEKRGLPQHAKKTFRVLKNV